MKKIIACLLVILSMISMSALSESAREYVESLGLSFTSTEPDNGESPHCMLLENDSFQSIGFNEDGILYTLMALPAYQSSFDPMAFYSLFRDLNAKYDWDVSLYWPGYPDSKIAVSYGIERDLDQTERNFTDRGEYLAALSARLGLEAEPAGQTTSPPADVDLAGMSFDELIALKDQINLAIWNSEEWQEVTVPQGRWIVGEDIPAGKWTVKCANIGLDNPYMAFTFISWGEKLDEDGDISYMDRYGSEFIYNPNSKYYGEGAITETTIEFFDGDIVDIGNSNNQAVFMPYTGKPSLGFK